MALRALCLFDGYGGFELGFRLAGLDIRTVARVERDSHAAATLVARMEEQTLDQAPIWDDVTTFDGKSWRGRVDIVTAGFNCQPFSAAGQRLGVDDERWLWPDIGRVLADVGPRFVFLENVPGLVRGGLPYICADLAVLGFDAEWGLLAASDVGAPHRRQRFWLLAWASLANDDDEGRVRVGWESAHDRDARDDADRSGRSDVGHTGRPRRPEITGSTPSHGSGDARRATHPTNDGDRPSQDVADTQGERGTPRNRPGTPRPNGRPEPQTGHLPTWPPRPDDHHGWTEWARQGGPQPQIRRRTNGRPLGLAESLHLGGNGLVPRVAAEALAALAVRAGIGTVTPVDNPGVGV